MAEGVRVRVAVRVRPLLKREVNAEINVFHPSEKQVRVGGKPDDKAPPQFFTYDSVFPSRVSQRDLYASTAARMLSSFLEGFNVTIIAYGQTGAGKTYTMGSESTASDRHGDEQRGLIPRFLQDLFASLNSDDPVRVSAKVTASFLEIYGEEIHDLLSTHIDPPNLQVAENAEKGIHVPGLTQAEVSSLDSALGVLQDGVLNRTTARTMMNDTSSRSHAIYTVTLIQTLRVTAAAGGDDGGDGSRPAAAADRDDGGGEGQGTAEEITTSRLTFVDLAGSERLARTMAEGKQMKEGIQINQGLLALGTVINALCEQEEKGGGGGKGGNGGRRNHVPYRQSKLTRLLQDALGGNSQTLFLACISPANDSNAETLSTLHYANRARNIKNKPVKNAGSDAAEARRLRVLMAVLQTELVLERFCRGPQRRRPLLVQSMAADAEPSPEDADADASRDAKLPAAGGGGGSPCDSPDPPMEELLAREDVRAYLESLRVRLNETVKVGRTASAGAPPPTLLLGDGLIAPWSAADSPMPPPPLPPPAASEKRAAMGPGGEQGAGRTGRRRQTGKDGARRKVLGSRSADPGPLAAAAASLGAATALGQAGSSYHGDAPGAGAGAASGGEAGSPVGSPVGGGGDGSGMEGDPEQELAILDRLIEWQRQSAEYDATAREDQRRIEAVDAEIRENEQMLLAMRGTLQGYHAMRQRYQELVAAEPGLREERDRRMAAAEAEMKAEAAAGGGAGGAGGVTGRGRNGGSGGGGDAEPKERLREVNMKLALAEREKKRLLHSFTILQREEERHRALEKTLSELKQQKVRLVREGKESAKRHREFELRKRREIEVLRKSERRQAQRAGRLDLELVRQRAALNRKNKEVAVHSDKVQKLEAHVRRLLSIKKPKGALERATHATAAARRGVAAAGAGGSGGGGGGIPPSGHGGGAANAGDGVGGGGGGAGLALSATERQRVSAGLHVLEAARQRRVKEAADRRTLELRRQDWERTYSRNASCSEELKAAVAEARAVKRALLKCGQENTDPADDPAAAAAASGKAARRVRADPGGGGGGSGGGGNSAAVAAEREELEGRRDVAIRAVQEAESAVELCQAQLGLLSDEIAELEEKLGDHRFPGDGGSSVGGSPRGSVGGPAGYGHGAGHAYSGGDGGDGAPRNGSFSGGVYGGGDGYAASGDGEAEDAAARELAVLLAGLEAAEARALLGSIWEGYVTMSVEEFHAQQAAQEKDAELVRLREEVTEAKKLTTRQAQGYSRRLSLMESDNRKELVKLSMLEAESSSMSGVAVGSGSVMDVYGRDADGVESAEATDRIMMGLGAQARSPKERRYSGGAGAGSSRASGGGGGGRISGGGGGGGSLSMYRSPGLQSPAGPGRRSGGGAWGGGDDASRRTSGQLWGGDAAAAAAAVARRASGQQIEALTGRHRELEKEAFDATAAAAAAKLQAQQLERELSRERAKCTELSERLALAEHVAAAAGGSVEGGNGDGDSSSTGASGAEAAAEAARLHSLWRDLGVDGAVRQEGLARVASAVTREVKLQADAAALQRAEAAEEATKLREELSALEAAMLGPGAATAEVRPFCKVVANEGVAATAAAVAVTVAAVSTAVAVAEETAAAWGESSVPLLEDLQKKQFQVDTMRVAAAAGLKRRAELRLKALALVRAVGIPPLPNRGGGESGGNDGFGGTRSSARLLVLLLRRRFVCPTDLHWEPCLMDPASQELLTVEEDGAYFYTLAGDLPTEELRAATATAAAAGAAAMSSGAGGMESGVVNDNAFMAGLDVSEKALKAFEREVKALSIHKAQVEADCRVARDAAAAATAELDASPEDVVALSTEFFIASANAAPAVAAAAAADDAATVSAGRERAAAAAAAAAAVSLPGELDRSALEYCAALTCDPRAQYVKVTPARTAHLRLCGAALAAAATRRRRVVVALKTLVALAHTMEAGAAAAGSGVSGPGGIADSGGETEAAAPEGADADGNAGGGGHMGTSGAHESLAAVHAAAAAALAAVAADAPPSYGEFSATLDEKRCALSPGALRAYCNELGRIAETLMKRASRCRSTMDTQWDPAGLDSSDRQRVEAQLAALTLPPSSPAAAVVAASAVAAVAAAAGGSASAVLAVAAAGADGGIAAAARRLQAVLARATPAVARLHAAAADAGLAEGRLLEGEAAAAGEKWERVVVATALFLATAAVQQRLARRAESLDLARRYDDEICQLVAAARAYNAARDPKRLCNKKVSAVYLLGEEKETGKKQQQFAKARQKLVALVTEMKAWEATANEGGPSGAAAGDAAHPLQRLSQTAREVVEAGVNGEKLFSLRIVQRRRLSGDEDKASMVAAAAPAAAATPGAAAVATPAAAVPSTGGGSGSGSPEEPAAGGGSGGAGASSAGCKETEPNSATDQFVRRDGPGRGSLSVTIAAPIMAGGGTGPTTIATAAAAVAPAATSVPATPRRMAGGAFAQLLDQSKGAGQVLHSGRAHKMAARVDASSAAAVAEGGGSGVGANVKDGLAVPERDP